MTTLQEDLFQFFIFCHEHGGTLKNHSEFPQMFNELSARIDRLENPPEIPVMGDLNTKPVAKALSEWNMPNIPHMFFVEIVPQTIKIFTDKYELEQTLKDYRTASFTPRVAHVCHSDIFQLLYLEVYLRNKWQVYIDDESFDFWEKRPKSFDTRNKEK